MPELSDYDIKCAEVVRSSSVYDYTPSEGYSRYLSDVIHKETTIPTREGETKVHIFTAKDLKKLAPVHIYVHGGGFARGHGVRDELCSAKYAALIQGIVYDIDYKLAPEYKFPCAFNEVYDVTKWIFDHIDEIGGDSENVTISGYSAGGNLTAAVAIRANETQDFKLRMQIICYAPTDLSTDPEQKPKLPDNMPPERSRMLNAMYVGDPDKANSHYVSMVFAPDNLLTGLPDALVIAAGNDVLKFEGIELAKRLIENGVKVTAKCFPGCRHGFMINCMDSWEEAQQLVIDTINKY